MQRGRAIPSSDGTTVRTAFTSAADGDLAVTGPPEVLAARRARITAVPWTWLHQVHGPDVVRVSRPGDHAGAEADAAVTATPGAALAVHTADCAGVLLWSCGGARTVVGAAHAGWRGLAAGVLEETVDAMAALGATDVHFELGPCITGTEYEFGSEELDLLVERYGPAVRTSTRWGTPALDLPAAVRTALQARGAREDAEGPHVCTASSGSHYSWRARRDTARQAAVIWIEAPGVEGTVG